MYLPHCYIAWGFSFLGDKLIRRDNVIGLMKLLYVVRGCFKSLVFSVFMFSISLQVIAESYIQSGPHFKAGLDYRLLQIPVRTESSTGDRSKKPQAKKTIEVRLLITHGCSECYEFQQMWEQWAAQLPENVNAKQSYIILGEESELLTEIYWTGKELNILSPVMEYLKSSTSGIESSPESPRQLVDVYEQYGITPEDVEQALSSMNVVMNMRKTKAISKIYRSRDVPAIIINGRYLTDIIGARSYENLLAVADYLVAKEMIALIPDGLVISNQ